MCEYRVFTGFKDAASRVRSSLVEGSNGRGCTKKQEAGETHEVC